MTTRCSVPHAFELHYLGAGLLQKGEICAAGAVNRGGCQTREMTGRLTGEVYVSLER